jgi:acyl-CoA synthetase (NDP forming)
MVRSIKGYKLLSGFRGEPRTDIATIERMLVGLSDLVLNHPEIKELDVNPLLVHHEGEVSPWPTAALSSKKPENH